MGLSGPLWSLAVLLRSACHIKSCHVPTVLDHGVFRVCKISRALVYLCMHIVALDCCC